MPAVRPRINYEGAYSVLPEEDAARVRAGLRRRYNPPPFIGVSDAEARAMPAYEFLVFYYQVAVPSWERVETLWEVKWIAHPQEKILLGGIELPGTLVMGDEYIEDMSRAWAAQLYKLRPDLHYWWKPDLTRDFNEPAMIDFKNINQRPPGGPGVLASFVLAAVTGMGSVAGFNLPVFAAKTLATVVKTARQVGEAKRRLLEMQKTAGGIGKIADKLDSAGALTDYMPLGWEGISLHEARENETDTEAMRKADALGLEHPALLCWEKSGPEFRTPAMQNAYLDFAARRAVQLDSLRRAAIGQMSRHFEPRSAPEQGARFPGTPAAEQMARALGWENAGQITLPDNEEAAPEDIEKGLRAVIYVYNRLQHYLAVWKLSEKFVDGARYLLGAAPAKTEVLSLTTPPPGPTFVPAREINPLAIAFLIWLLG